MVEVNDEMIEKLIDRMNDLCYEIDDYQAGIPMWHSDLSRRFYDIVRAWVAELTNGVD